MSRSPSLALSFAAAVRTVSESTRLQGLEVPIFRSPPRRRDAVRTLERTPRGVTVSVVTAGRDFDEVVGDLVDGVVAANRLTGAPAIRCRTALWSALARMEDAA